MKPTLFVLAAGMGSRYGGLKQLDGVGPNGETIMDYSIFDAIRGGFGKVVFVMELGMHHNPEEISTTVQTSSGVCPKDRKPGISQKTRMKNFIKRVFLGKI